MFVLLDKSGRTRTPFMDHLKHGGHDVRERGLISHPLYVQGWWPTPGPELARYV